ncbi:MAG: HNH endonuclease [Methylobacter sp.]
MNKDEYYKISEKGKIPKRCPILDKCMRRYWTILFFSYRDLVEREKGISINEFFSILKKDGDVNVDIESCIQLRGENPSFRDHYNFSCMCPEISLFDSEGHSMDCIPTEAISSVKTIWDSSKRQNDLIFEHRHYSECPEFCFWQFENKNNVGKKTTQRTSISRQLRFEIFQRDNFTCQYCNKSKDDGASLQIDHKKPLSKGGTDSFENLITACSDCNLGKSDKTID